MYSIDDFKECNKASNIVMTQHSRKRFAERGITVIDVMQSINSGEIIEQYLDDKPFPSCLIMGRSGEKVLHIVASIDEKMIYLVTAYIPDPEKWEADLKTRKER